MTRTLAALVCLTALVLFSGSAGAQCPPRIIFQNYESWGCHFETHGFIARAEGDAPLSFRWFHDGVALDDAAGEIDGAFTDLLFVHNASDADRGVYQCAVTNACGAVYSDPASLSFSCCIDFNGDGSQGDQDDVACLINVISGNPGCTPEDPDINQDGSVDQDDLIWYINYISEPIVCSF